MIVLSSIAIGLLFVSWIAYPLLSWARARRTVPSIGRGPFQPISAVVVTRDSIDMVVTRVENLLEAQGCEIREVIVALDYSASERRAALSAALPEICRVVIGDAPGGKAAGLNAGVRAATSTWVLLADSGQTFHPDTVRRLAEGTGDGLFSAVSGRVAHTHDDPVMRLYWTYENTIRLAQSRLHSVVTTSGAICLMERAAWVPIPVGAICDDLFITLSIVESGGRVGYVPEAVAIDARRLSKQQLFQKKVRTLTGLWQLLRWRPHVLDPRRNPIWGHFLFHKLARLATPYLFVLAILGAVPVGVGLLQRSGWLPPAALAGLVLLTGIVRPRLARSGLASFAWALSLLVVPVIATSNGLRGNWGVWQQHSALPGAK